MPVAQISGCLKEVIDLALLFQAQKKRYFFAVKNFFPVGLFQYSGQHMVSVALLHANAILYLLWQRLPLK
jgi:hypothetical protein